MFPFKLMPETEDEKFMLEALKQAFRAFQEKEVPVGAVLVHEGKIIAKGKNEVELLKDATAHAEMICLTAGAEHLNNWRLLNTTLYTTLEPCSMCAGALFLSRVNRVVYGAKDLRHGAFGSWVNLLEKPHPTHTLEVVGGVYEQEAMFLMKDFFKRKRAS